MSSYLSDRYKRVNISNCRSSWIWLTKGIPHSSWLGQLLLNVFMNDIFYFMEICDFVNYADDNTLSIIRSTIQLVLSAKMQKMLCHGFKKNHASKCWESPIYVMKNISKETIPEFIEISYIQLKWEREIKLLGKAIDDKIFCAKSCKSNICYVYIQRHSWCKRCKVSSKKKEHIQERAYSGYIC